MPLLYGFLISMFLMLFAWCLYLKINNAALIDVFWGANITFIGMVNLSARPFDLLSRLDMMLLIIWGTRLTLFYYLHAF